MNLEVGNVYLRTGSSLLFLAVSTTLLVAWKDGAAIEFRPRTKKGLEVQRSVYVGELCDSWGVGSRVLDHITQLYVRPEDSRDSSPKQKRRDGQKGTAAQEFEWRKQEITRRFHKG